MDTTSMVMAGATAAAMVRIGKGDTEAVEDTIEAKALRLRQRPFAQ